MNGGTIEGNINNSETPDGSAIYSSGSLDFNDVTISGNSGSAPTIYLSDMAQLIEFTDVEIFNNIIWFFKIFRNI